MDSQNLPTQKDNGFIERLKQIVSRYIGATSNNSSQIIQAAATDDSMTPEMKSAAVSIIEKEARRIKTRKRIVEKAESIKSDDENISDEKPTDDWMTRFFNIVEDVTEDTMQNLWAQILAGEVKRPHTFSLRTLDLLHNMTKEDAELYVRVINSYCFDRLILTENQYGISLEDRIALSEMGLLSPDELTQTITQTQEVNLMRLNQKYVLKLNKDTTNNIEVNFGCRALTKSGRELLQLVDDKGNYDMFAYVASKFKKAGMTSVSLHKVLKWGEEGQVSYFITPEKIY